MLALFSRLILRGRSTGTSVASTASAAAAFTTKLYRADSTSPVVLSSSAAFAAAASTRMFSSTPTALGLEDFFDSNKGWVWDEKELPTGRAWLAAELRNKSFDDLHKLWWACCKEQNKLYSQQTESRRFDLFFPHKGRIRQTRITMSRIKLVVWERREAWMQAQAVIKRETARQELASAGMSNKAIELRLREMFPKPIEESGKAVERKRFTIKTSRTKKYRSKKQNSRPTHWSVV